MGRQAAVQLRVAVNAFADRDCSWASALADMDEAMDELERSLFRHILGASSPDEAVVVRAVQLALVARHYERIGDHAVTIAEQVHLVVTGTRAAASAPPDGRSRDLIDEAPACGVRAGGLSRPHTSGVDALSATHSGPREPCEQSRVSPSVAGHRRNRLLQADCPRMAIR